MDAVATLVSPAWALAFLLAALNVLVFRIALAREGHSALYLLPFGIFGFAAGNLVGVLLNSPLPTLGDVRLIEACIGAWIFLSLANAREAQ